MIIDASYFVGKLNLPGAGNTEGLANINLFINDYEDEYLQKVLGYDLWKAFVAGLLEVVPEQKWLDLLEGKEFQYKGRTRKWIGFVPLSTGSSFSIDDNNRKELVVDGPGAFDPVGGSASMTLPPEFVDEDFIISFRVTGPLRSDEYSVVGNILTLTAGTFNTGATLFLLKGPSISLGTDSTIKKSPIANYVYYRFLEDDAINTTLVGQVANKSDNATRVSPKLKMIDAWNRMVDYNTELFRFLQSGTNSYPEWNERQFGNELYHKKNSFDL